MSQEKDDFSDWWSIPEPVLLRVLSYLKPCDVAAAASTCKRWYSIGYDDWIWHKLFLRDFKLDRNIDLKPGKCDSKPDFIQQAMTDTNSRTLCCW